MLLAFQLLTLNFLLKILFYLWNDLIMEVITKTIVGLFYILVIDLYRRHGV